MSECSRTLKLLLLGPPLAVSAINCLEGWIMERLFEKLRRGFQAGVLAGFGVGFVAGSGVAILMIRHLSNRQVSCVIICRSACSCKQRGVYSFSPKRGFHFQLNGCGLHMFMCVLVNIPNPPTYEPDLHVSAITCTLL